MFTNSVMIADLPHELDPKLLFLTPYWFTLFADKMDRFLAHKFPNLCSCQRNTLDLDSILNGT